MSENKPKIYVGDSDAGTGAWGYALKASENVVYNGIAAFLKAELLDETAERNGLTDDEIQEFLFENYEDKEKISKK